MVSEAISIDEYLESDTDVKFEFLYENFSIMKFLIKNYRSDLISEVMEQKSSNRRAENGEIGVRVQVSLGVNSPTESMAINKTIIGKAIDEGFLDDEFFKDTDDRQELIRKVTCYHTVNADWEAFSSKLNTMTISDQQILKPYLMKQKSLLDLASEMGIDYRSAMGHRSIETTMDIYAEATERKKQESFEILAAKLDSIFEKGSSRSLTTKIIKCNNLTTNLFLSRRIIRYHNKVDISQKPYDK